MNSDADFFALELGSGDPNSLTPAMGEREEGVRLAAPGRVDAGRSFVIPITAIARFTTEGRNALPRRLWQSLVLVAWDSTHNRLYAGMLGDPSPIPEAEEGAEPGPAEEEPSEEEPMLPPAPVPPAQEEPPDAPLVEGPEEPLPPSGPPVPLTGGYFAQYRTFDLLEVLPLPPSSARYLVFATYGPHHSNSVRIEVTEPGKGR